MKIKDNVGLWMGCALSGASQRPNSSGLDGNYCEQTMPCVMRCGYFGGRTYNFELMGKIHSAKPINSHYGDQICSQANQRMPVKEPVMCSDRFVAYYRVSTLRQGVSGLGLEAQRAATTSYLVTIGGELLAEITEVESGKKDKRPELAAAIQRCRETGATLLIAKLDRLARNVAFIANLLESGVRFIAVDMPTADRFMLHVYAAMAEEEGRRISERTHAALASAKARGVVLGRNGSVLAERHQREARSFAQGIEATLRLLVEEEGVSYRRAAERLNELKVPTARGGDWHSTSVYRAWQRICTSGEQ